uniref:Uncharacterized protein n=1 Tax=Capsaspora owczarzaki TaxID=192875 RepID=M1KFE0_9EUKA|nr:hypothetical protein [Capsaspora owczarzaki]
MIKQGIEINILAPALIKIQDIESSVSLHQSNAKQAIQESKKKQISPVKLVTNTTKHRFKKIRVTNIEPKNVISSWTLKPRKKKSLSIKNRQGFSFWIEKSKTPLSLYKKRLLKILKKTLKNKSLIVTKKFKNNKFYKANSKRNFNKKFGYNANYKNANYKKSGYNSGFHNKSDFNNKSEFNSKDYKKNYKSGFNSGFNKSKFNYKDNIADKNYSFNNKSNFNYKDNTTDKNYSFNKSKFNTNDNIGGQNFSNTKSNFNKNSRYNNYGYNKPSYNHTTYKK